MGRYDPYNMFITDLKTTDSGTYYCCLPSNCSPQIDEDRCQKFVLTVKGKDQYCTRLVNYSYPCLDKNKWIISKKRSWDVYHLYHISDEKSIVQRPSKGNISEWALDNFPPQPRGSNIEPFSVLANFNHTGVNWYFFLYGWKNWVPRHA